MSSAETDENAQLTGLITENGLRGMLEGTKFYTADMVNPSISSFSSKSPGFGDRFERTSMNVQYIDIFHRVPISQREENGWRRS